jgi:hypothetical protein
VTKSVRSARGPSKKKKAGLRAASLETRSSPSPAFSTRVTDAVQALRNNETRVLSEVKSSSGKITMDTKVSYPAELVAAFRGLFGAGKMYSFQLHVVSTQTSTAGGGLLGSVTINPSVTSYGEWSALSALFDEVVGVSSQLDWLTLNASATTGGAVADMVLAFDEQSIASSAPASVLAVFRLAESQTYVPDFGDAGSGKHRQFRKLTSRYWCSTATPVSVSPIGGLAGSWSFGNSGLYGASVPVATLFLITVAKFRNRA